MNRSLAVAALFILLAWGDGGSVLFRKQAGPFMVTAFAEKLPVRAGAADLSVLVQRVSDESNVLDAQVNVRLRQSAGGKIEEVMAPASHSRATNKLLYAAHITIPSAGLWTLSVYVSGKNGSGTASGDLNASPPQSPAEANWPYFVLVPVMIVLFILNRWLRKKWRAKNPPARP